MDFQMDLQDSYRVEVSGWDALENFFVEKTVLSWSCEEKKEVSLRAPIREGCVVFVRLLQPVANGNNFPLAYQAVKVMPRDSTGARRVRLAQLRPRTSYRETTLLLSEAATRVA